MTSGKPCLLLSNVLIVDPVTLTIRMLNQGDSQCRNNYPFFSAYARILRKRCSVCDEFTAM